MERLEAGAARGRVGVVMAVLMMEVLDRAG
jgi:hypothetical protein